MEPYIITNTNDYHDEVSKAEKLVKELNADPATHPYNNKVVWCLMNFATSYQSQNPTLLIVQQVLKEIIRPLMEDKYLREACSYAHFPDLETNTIYESETLPYEIYLLVYEELTAFAAEEGMGNVHKFWYESMNSALNALEKYPASKQELLIVLQKKLDRDLRFKNPFWRIPHNHCGRYGEYFNIQKFCSDVIIFLVCLFRFDKSETEPTSFRNLYLCPNYMSKLFDAMLMIRYEHEP